MSAATPARPRCPRGHFAPTTGTCRCTRTRPAHLYPDLAGQPLPAGARITDIPLATNYL